MFVFFFFDDFGVPDFRTPLLEPRQTILIVGLQTSNLGVPYSTMFDLEVPVEKPENHPRKCSLTPHLYVIWIPVVPNRCLLNTR